MNDNQAETPVALFDMDQTLFDFEGQMRKDLARLMSPGEPNPIDETDPNYVTDLWEAEEKFPWLKARASLIKRRPGWWRELPIMQLGLDIFLDCTEMGYQTEILTKGPNRNPHAWAEKYECLKLHPQLANCPIHMSENKGRIYGRVLVDDFKPYVEAWLRFRPRGLVVMPANSSNASFTHPNVIRYNGGNRAEVKALLRAAFFRQDGQHWKKP